MDHRERLKALGYLPKEKHNIPCGYLIKFVGPEGQTVYLEEETTGFNRHQTLFVEGIVGKPWALTTRTNEGENVWISFHKTEALAKKAFARYQKTRGNKEPLFVERNYTK